MNVLLATKTIARLTKARTDLFPGCEMFQPVCRYLFLKTISGSKATSYSCATGRLWGRRWGGGEGRGGMGRTTDVL